LFSKGKYLNLPRNDTEYSQSANRLYRYHTYIILGINSSERIIVIGKNGLSRENILNLPFKLVIKEKQQ